MNQQEGQEIPVKVGEKLMLFCLLLRGKRNNLVVWLIIIQECLPDYCKVESTSLAVILILIDAALESKFFCGCYKF